MAKKNDMQVLAQQVADSGRYGDNYLVHMNGYEIEALNNQLGGTMTVNPDTGMPEAFFPFLAGLFGGLGAAGAAAAAPAAIGAGALGAGTAAGLGAAGLGAGAGALGAGTAAGLGSAGMGALGAGTAAALPAAATAAPAAAGLGAAALPATAAAAPLSGAGAGALPGALGAAAPAAAAAPTAAAPAALPGALAGTAPAIPAAEVAAASTQAGIPGSLAGAAPSAQLASAAPGGLPGAALETGKIGARLPGMIPPSATPTPLPATPVSTTPMQGGFGGTMVPEIGAPSAPMSAPVPSPSAMFDPMAAEAIQPSLTAPKGPTGLSLVDPGLPTVEGPLGPVGQAGVDITKSFGMPGGPLPQPAGPMTPASRVAGAFGQPFPAPGNMAGGLPGATPPMPADATVTMASAAPPPTPAAAQPPLSPVDIPGSGLTPTPEPVVPAEPVSDMAFAGTPEATPEALAAETMAGEPEAAERGFLGGIGMKEIIPAALVASAMMPSSGGGMGDDDEDEDEEGRIPTRDPELDVASFPGADFVGGVSPEWNYFPNRYAFANGGLVSIPFDIDVGEPSISSAAGSTGSSLAAPTMGEPSGLPGAPVIGAAPRDFGMPMNSPDAMQTFQNGGEVLGKPDPRVQLIDAAEQALMGRHPEPDKAIKDFVDAFGESALNRLQQAIMAKLQGGEEPRMVKGPGGPKDDKIPARINNVEEARLSDGEVVIPADAVSGAGGGNQEAGAARLMQMSQQLAGKPPLPAMPVEQVPA